VATAHEPDSDLQRELLGASVGVDDAVPQLEEFGEEASVAGDDLDLEAVVGEGEFAGFRADLAVDLDEGWFFELLGDFDGGR